MDVGERIKIARMLKGLTQKDLAQKLGYKSLTVSRWERGERSPDIEDLSRLAEILNVNLHWLLTGEGDMFIEQEGEDEIQELISELQRIKRDYGENHYQRAINLVKKLLQDIQSFSESSVKKKKAN